MWVNLSCFVLRLHSSHMRPSANSTSLLTPYVGVCSSFTKWCHPTMQAPSSLSTGMIWSDVLVKSHFYGLWLWFLSSTYCNNYSLKQTPTKALCLFFYHPSRGGKLLRRDFSQAVLHWGLRSRASSSHFPFRCFTSWDVLMNQVVFGNHHTPGYTALSWHSRRSINTCGADNESWIITINHPKHLAFSLLPRQWFSNFLASNQVLSKARGCAGLIPPAPS